MRTLRPLVFVALSLLQVSCLGVTDENPAVDAGLGPATGGAQGQGGTPVAGTGGTHLDGHGGLASGGAGVPGGRGGEPSGGGGGEPIGGVSTRPDSGTPDADCQSDANCDPGRVCDIAHHRCIDSVNCTRDNECEPAALCVAGRCTAPLGPCSNDRDCPEGTLCENSSCVRESIPCATDRDCPEPTVCADGLCVAGVPCGGSLCGDGEICRDAQCVPAACVGDGDCQVGESCVSGECAPRDPPECTVDGDCGAGRACRQGICTDPGAQCVRDADCGAGQRCLDGVCQAAPPECLADPDCAGDEVCRDGVCVPDLPGCLNDADCRVEQICTQGACVPRPAECAGNGDCRAPELCVQGACVAPPPECVGNADCPAGEVCRVNVCVADAALCDADLDCVVGTICLNGRCAVPGAAPVPRACNPRAADPGCPDTQLCLPTEPCAENAANCRGRCAASTCDACTPSAACGGQPSTCVPGHPAAFCGVAGPGALGDACDLDQNQLCRAGLSCIYGECRQPCGGAECGAGSSVCPAAQRCVDLSGVNGGRDFSFCLADCDVFAQRGCAPGESCLLTYHDPNADVTVGFCNDVAPSGRLTQNQACAPAADHFWGNCRADHICSEDLTPGEAICYGFCTANNTQNCTGLSRCALGTLDGDLQVGLCMGNCGVWGNGPACGAGETCQIGAIGQEAGGEDVFTGFCLAGAGNGQPGDPCTTDAFTRGTDCRVGTTCIDTGDLFGTTCAQLCDTRDVARGCPGGQSCSVNVFGAYRPQGASPTLGVCL